MYRISLALLCCVLLACGGNDGKATDISGPVGDNTKVVFSKRFAVATVPYLLSDTALRDNHDTASLSGAYLSMLIPDTTLRQVFGKTEGIKYTPIVKLEPPARESYYVIKASSGSKKAALLLVFDKTGSYAATLPFLVPDDKPATYQSTSFDKSYAVTKATVERSKDEVVGEGKEVWAYDQRTRAFSLIMTDRLNDNPGIVVNPLDTFSKSNKLAGDYYLDKKNLVAVRDGRHQNQILVYIHTENSDGDCKGELKGEFILTGPNSAVYRQGGDPCVLALTFAGNSVSIHEERGCGNYRGLDCPLTGSFTRKKEEKPKDATKKPKRKKQP